MYLPSSVEEMELIPGACVPLSVDEMVFDSRGLCTFKCRGMTLTQGACVPLSVGEIALIPGARVSLRKDEMILILEAFLQMSLSVWRIWL